MPEALWHKAWEGIRNHCSEKNNHYSEYNNHCSEKSNRAGEYSTTTVASKRPFWVWITLSRLNGWDFTDWLRWKRVILGEGIAAEGFFSWHFYPVIHWIDPITDPLKILISSWKILTERQAMVCLR